MAKSKGNLPPDDGSSAPKLTTSERLEPRKATILRAVVWEYVETAEPVGSEILSARYSLGVKSATIRNEMAELLDLGFLKQPHTSAGRIPSDQGYRFFVDELPPAGVIEDSNRSDVQSAASQNDSLVPVLRDTVRALSRLLNLLSVATTVRQMDVIIRTVVISALGPSQALLVIALSNGHVENRLIEVPVGITLTDIGRTNEVLSSLIGKNIRSLIRMKTPTVEDAGAPARLVAIVWSQLRAISRNLTRGKLVTEGEEFLFAQPEFRRDAGALSHLLTELVDGDTLYEAVNPGEGAQTVTIGQENRDAKLQDLSVIRQSFYVGDQEAGVIAVIGPTRMQYNRGISLVDFTAKALTESLTRYLG
jgi:heat-inducible transcriptional repressor